MTMSETRTVTATFTLSTVSYTLTVSRSGTGRGTITSSPIGISCGYDCSQSYASGTVVTLTAVASSGTVFTGWSGACEGTSTTCQVTMSSSKTVTASFISMPAGAFYLGVTKAGTGTGTVTSAPQGITCGTSCAQIYASGILLKLTAVPSPGSIFTGWSGACGGTGYCWVTMTATRYVKATFSLSTAYNGPSQVTQMGKYDELSAHAIPQVPLLIQAGRKIDEIMNIPDRFLSALLQ